MAGIPKGLSPHRKKNPRQCDRCRERAEWNYRPAAGPVQYLCDEHVPWLDRSSAGRGS